MSKEVVSKTSAIVLQPYKERFEAALPHAFAQFGQETRVKEAMCYALSGEGKRFRPALVYMIADALKSRVDVTASALAVEYFHTSSLIADDLPCMDNDDLRRGRPTTHKVYGEAIALLASYGLIAAGFELIAKNDQDNGGDVVKIAVIEAAKQMGTHGLIGGQYFDLFPKGFEHAHLLEVIQMKTVALFDLSFSLGWLFGGGAKEKLSRVQQAAMHFGIAFQILDDLDDQQKDKEANSQANFANRFGVSEALKAINHHIAQFHKAMEDLQLSCPPLTELAKAVSSSFAG